MTFAFAFNNAYDTLDNRSVKAETKYFIQPDRICNHFDFIFEKWVYFQFLVNGEHDLSIYPDCFLELLFLINFGNVLPFLYFLCSYIFNDELNHNCDSNDFVCF